jgi:hypothetical protein
MYDFNNLSIVPLAFIRTLHLFQIKIEKHFLVRIIHILPAEYIRIW